MKVIVVKDYDAVSKEAFDVMKEVVTSKKDEMCIRDRGSTAGAVYRKTGC